MQFVREGVSFRDQQEASERMTFPSTPTKTSDVESTGHVRSSVLGGDDR